MPLGVQGRNSGSAVFLAMLPTLTAWKLWGKENPISIIQYIFILAIVLPIHILLIINGFHDSSFINMGWKRHLNENAMDAIIIVKLFDFLE